VNGVERQRVRSPAGRRGVEVGPAVRQTDDPAGLGLADQIERGQLVSVRTFVAVAREGSWRDAGALAEFALRERTVGIEKGVQYRRFRPFRAAFRDDPALRQRRERVLEIVDPTCRPSSLDLKNSAFVTSWIEPVNACMTLTACRVIRIDRSPRIRAVAVATRSRVNDASIGISTTKSA